MSDVTKKRKRFTAIFLLGVISFNYPILSLFNLKKTFFGLPLLYIYIFTAWGIVILLLALVSRIRPPTKT